MTLFWIVGANLLSRFVVVMGAALLPWRWLSRYSRVITAFAAGLLLSISTLHLIPEGMHSGVDIHDVGWIFLAAFLFFGCVELLAGCKHESGVQHNSQAALLSSFSNRSKVSIDWTRIIPLAVAASAHNAVDGLLIAAAFMTDVQTGLLVTMAVIVHEIAVVIGQLMILKQAGMSTKHATALLFGCAMFAVISGMFGYWVFATMQAWVGYAMVVSAAGFIFVVLAVLLPEITNHSNETCSCLDHGNNRSGQKNIWGALIALFAGVLLAATILMPLHERTHEWVSADIHAEDISDSDEHEHVH